ncbi:xanthine dehydrogenase family protein subunit M [Roseiarcaceae bacterium H3SJ34-1]|uniref:FAD binding domain-containing protein n=1 Tax=Terripilifer ovatus TaxID=3032367 RepID=UPI003AB96810|nr:xanthine dehydrogenase family protein subunit M [Roseiarcaceae bacterium H3SJ34-1]
MRDFELVRPSSLAEAIALLDTEDGGVRAFSGGTGLMLMMKTGVFTPTSLVRLDGIEPEHAAIGIDDDGSLRIGALATLSTVEHSPIVQKVAPLIPEAMKRLANVRVRNAARIGGNLAHGDPHMDLPPVLAALHASVRAVGPDGERTIAVEDLFAGYYETVLGRGELLTQVIVPSQAGWASVYHKCTTRSADDWPALGVAVSLRVVDGVIADSRLMVSAATEKLTRLVTAEAQLKGAETKAETFARAADAAVAEAETIDDARGSAEYKSSLLHVYVRRALRDALSRGALQ